MTLMTRILSAALVVGTTASLAGPARAVPMAASLSLRDASTPAVQTIQWRHGGRGGAIGSIEAAGDGVAWALGWPPGP
jgi:hypothetical protein